jgi:hypothetical protein
LSRHSPYELGNRLDQDKRRAAPQGRRPRRLLKAKLPQNHQVEGVLRPKLIEGLVPMTRWIVALPLLAAGVSIGGGGAPSADSCCARGRRIPGAEATCACSGTATDKRGSFRPPFNAPAGRQSPPCNPDCRRSSAVSLSSSIRSSLGMKPRKAVHGSNKFPSKSYILFNATGRQFPLCTPGRPQV